jgi:hypothetical protein
MRIEFVNGLMKLGFAVNEMEGNRLWFPYLIPVGCFAETEIKLGFEVNDDFPVVAPHGPHIAPLLLPITGGGGTHPYGAIHASPFGPEWEHWSRPHPEWEKTDRSVKAYMSFIRRLFDFP